MKKILFLFLTIILLCPITIYAKTCESNNIELKSIVQARKSEGTEENTYATINNNKVNIDISMSEVNDYIEYNIDVENKTDEELAFNGKSITSSDGYFNYTFTYENDSNIIPAHEDKIVSMKITYANEIDSSKFNNNMYNTNDNKKLGLMDPSIVNPKTYNYFYIFFISILGFISISGVFIIKNKYMKAFLLLLCLIPTTVYATCSYELEVNTKIEVSSIPGPVSFSTDSWEIIVNAVRKNNTSVYNVGDTKDIELDGFGTYPIRIANKSSSTECSQEGFSQTACGFVLEFTKIINNQKMNNSSTNVGGWEACNARNYINSTIYNAMPSELKNIIIDTKVVSGHGCNNYNPSSWSCNDTEPSPNFTTTDKLYLLSTKEVGFEESNDTARTETRTLDYYSANNTSTAKQKRPNTLNNGYNDYYTWWLRSAASRVNTGFFEVDTDGSYYGGSATNQAGISPAFKIG